MYSNNRTDNAKLEEDGKNAHGLVEIFINSNNKSASNSINHINNNSQKRI